VKIEMKKFGTILNGRPAGREAYLRVIQIVNGSGSGEKGVVLDFAGVEVLTPSFADEFLRLLREKYGNDGIHLENTGSATVKETLESIS
jgi:hypothetical protein